MDTLYSEFPAAGSIYLVGAWVDEVKSGTFIDRDGFGYPARSVNGVIRMDVTYSIYPSEYLSIPVDAEYIVWFNR